MALVYPGTAAIPQYESSLAKFMPAFEKGQAERRDSDAFDAAASAFGGGASPAPEQPESPLARLMGSLFGGQKQGPFTRPETAVAAIDAAAPPMSPAPGTQIATSDTSQLPSGYLANARSAESGGNDAAANPNSSALGRYQFLDSTWQGLMQQYPELGLTPNGRTDPAQQERAMAKFTQDNARTLSGSGIPVNPGTLYAAHFLGAGGAQKALTADPATPMSALVDPGVISANPHLQGMTAGDFAQWAQRKGGGSSGGASGGYTPPMQDVGAGQGRPFTVDEGTMRTLLASEATRPLAVSLIQAQQETQASQGRFVTEEGDDGSIWQRDTLTGEQKVIREAPAPKQQRIVQGPDGNSYYEDGSRVLPGVSAQPARPMTPEERATWGIPESDVRPYTFGDDGVPKPVGGAGQNITVNTSEGQDGALNKALSENEGKAWAGYKEAATVSASNAQDFEILNELLQLAPQGPITGRLAETFKGFSAAGDAANSIVKRIAPTLRAPGSGATSDIEYDGMLRSLPALGNSPEANQMILSIMQAKAQINMERGRIITAYQNGDIDIAQARNAINELDSKSIMTPDMRRALLGVGGDGNVSPAQSQPVGEGTVIEDDNGNQLILRNGQWEPVT